MGTQSVFVGGWEWKGDGGELGLCRGSLSGWSCGILVRVTWAVSTDSNYPVLNRTANEDYIDFLLRSINKIN